MANVKQYSSWLWGRSRGVRGALAANILLSFVSIALNLAFIWLSKRLVDAATGVKEASAITILAVLLVSAMLTRIIINAVRARIEANTTSRMNFIIRQQLFGELMQAQFQGKEKNHSGDTVNRLFTDVDTVTRVICQDLPGICTTLFQLAAGFALLSTMDIRLALILLFITPAFAAFSKVFFSRMRKLTRDIRESESLVQSHIQESLQHKAVLQSLEQGQASEERLDNLQQGEYSQVLRRTRFSVFSRTIVSIAFGAGYCTALLWGVHGLYTGAITFGVLTAFLQLVGQIQNPSMQLTRQIPALVSAAASVDRLMEMEGEPKEQEGEAIRLQAPAGVRIEGVSFTYPDGEAPVLSGFSHDFAPGSRTAIVGETGVGKSTLIRLILSLLRPSEGRVVFYSGTEEAEASPQTRANVVYVPQGNTLFSGTIRENLLMGCPSATEQQLKQALRTAAAEFVFSLPEGLNTVCGEQGAGLSEGQAQRIAIARGLLRPGSVMLLDEFSSSLDPQTEDRLLRGLVEGAEGKTMIFITHREAIAEYCSETLRMEK